MDSDYKVDDAHPAEEVEADVAVIIAFNNVSFFFDRIPMVQTRPSSTGEPA